MEQQKMRALAVVPYEGLKALMQKVCETEFPQIELTVLVGNWKEGLDLAQRNVHEGFDVIISRGGTALLLRNKVKLPVIEIPLTALDILRAQRLTDGLSNRYAIVGFPNMAQNAIALNKIFNQDMDIYAYSLPEDPQQQPDALYKLLEQLRDKGYRAILGDKAAADAAQRLGLNAVMLSSGIESIREVFNSALQLCSSIRELRNANHILRKLLREQACQTVVFEQNQTLYFSTLSSQDNEPLENMLRMELVNVPRMGSYRFAKNLGGVLYTIKAQSFHIGATDYTVFYLTSRKVQPSSQAGIRHCSATDLQSFTRESFYSFIENSAGLRKAIEYVNLSTSPVLLTGEHGMEIESAAAAVCLGSRLKATPVTFIDCALLNNQSWTYLLNHHSSPLMLTGWTIYFQNFDALSSEKRTQLIGCIASANLCGRDQLLFSCTCPHGTTNAAAGYEVMEKLSAQLVNLPPLRELRRQLPQMANLCLSQLNANLPVEIYGMEETAVQLLQEYDWPHNLAQFRRLLSTLAITAQDQLIRTDAVQRLLKEERQNSCLAQEGQYAPLNLKGTLEEITQEVLRLVLEETGGNQTAAAKRLGIARTTLWRLLKTP